MFRYYRLTRVLEYEFVGFATTTDTFSECVKSGLSQNEMLTPYCFRILVDVTAYGQNMPTQTIDLCSFINCPISGDTVQGKYPLTVLIGILG